MQLVTYDVPCGDCGATTKLEVNLFDGRHRVLKTSGAGGHWTFRQKQDVVEYFKGLKGYTRELMPTWDAKYRGRAFKAVGELLDFLAVLPDPVAVAKEALLDLDAEAKKGGWTWTLETAVKRAPEWLLTKQKEPRP